jgi:NAD(P)-dependent dehydrogenase (short-subunit alcohol dehydrogenase family)
MPLAMPPALGTHMLPADTFEGQVVYITGGGTGLGKAIALEFARAGADVAIASRDEHHRRTGVDAIESLGRRAVGTAVDVRDPAQIARSFDTVENSLGPISILINNAAGNFPVPAERMSPNAWRAVVGIVLDGTFYCSTEFARRRIACGQGGSILNIGAPYVSTGAPVVAHSGAAKAGVENLTKSLAVEWAPDGIRINTLAPGLFPVTDRSERSPTTGRTTGIAEFADRTQPAGRVGQGQELGWFATFMCSPYAAFLTGQTIILDGARALRWYGLGAAEFEPVRDGFDRRQREARQHD